VPATESHATWLVRACVSALIVTTGTGLLAPWAQRSAVAADASVVHSEPPLVQKAAALVGPLLAPAIPPRPPAVDPRSPRPDIVVIMLDDIPPLDGRLWQRLPHIRRTFVAHGVELTDAHGETPICCPGRAGFLTGLHTHHHGATTTDGSRFQPQMTIATALKGVGYHTIHVGKYLNLFERIYPKVPPGWSEFHGFGGGYQDYILWSDGVPRHYGRARADYSTTVISKLSAAAIRRVPPDRRLFAWITPFAMHKPWQLPGRQAGRSRCSGIEPWSPPGYMERDVRDKPAHIRRLRVRQEDGYDLRRICRGLLAVDRLVGNVVRELDRRGRLDDTLLLLTSDNGMTYGSQRVLRDKKTPYATQLPFFVRWPRVLGDDHRRIGERIQNIDLAPTLCDIAGCRLGPYPTGQGGPDGLSFLRLLTGERTSLPRDAVLSSYLDPDGWMPTWWSVSTTSRSPLARQGCRTRREAGCRWLYVEYDTGEVELYDRSNGPCWDWRRRMSGDPCLLENLAGRRRYAELQAMLARRLDRLR
jgi:arylsulfatase A-like enzyme